MSLMHKEILATPHLLSNQLTSNVEHWQTFIRRCQEYAPTTVMTLARGSSNHAAIFAKYLIETELGLPTAAFAPSVISIYHRPIKLERVLVLAISQSGQSPDLIEVMSYARKSGALTLTLTNDTMSPLASMSEFVIPLHAGPEQAVAATKSFLLSLGALIQGISLLKPESNLALPLAQLPELMDQVLKLPVHAHFKYFEAQNAFILGRGFGLSIAKELALKFKEVTQIHAEAFSAAELLHGPFSLLQKQIPVLALSQNDTSLPTLLSTLMKIKNTGNEPLILASEDTKDCFRDFPKLILFPTTHPMLTPLLACAFFYLLIENLAIHKGLNSDHPPLIQKITKTQ